MSTVRTETAPAAPAAMPAERRGAARTALIIAVVAVIALVAVATHSLFETVYARQGISDPGFGAALLYALLRFTAALAGGLTLGALAYTLICAPATAQGRIDAGGYRGVRIAELISPVWAVATLLLIPASAADQAGLSLQGMLRRGALGALIDAQDHPKSWIVASIAVVLVAVLVRFAFAWASVLGLAAISAVGVLAPAVDGNAAEGPNHDYATGAVIPFTIALAMLVGLTWCVLTGLDNRRAERPTIVRRYRIAVGLGVAVMIPTAAILMAILAPPAKFGGWYGWLAVTAAILLAAHALLAWWLRPDRDVSRLRPVLLATVVAEVVWLGISVVMAIQPAPAFDNRRFTVQQAFLGFDLPRPPSLWTFATVWRFDVVLGTAAIALAVAYVLGVVRLRRRGDAWPVWRTVSWLAGCLGLLLFTSSGISAYSYGMFSMHMVVHMALNMFLPELLVLGGPVTLLLRAVEPAGRESAPGPREWVLWLMHSRFVKLLSHPGIALGVFVVSLYGLYFTSVFNELIRFHWGHLLMNIHFLLTGYLFYSAIIGIDPGPRRLPHLGRLGMLFAIMPFHAFFGIAVMSMTSLIGPLFYPELGLSWMHDLMHDQWMGGTLAWISGEIPALLVVGALLRQWSRQDHREAARADRHQDRYPEDDELAAYNAMLAQLSQARRTGRTARSVSE